MTHSKREINDAIVAYIAEVDPEQYEHLVEIATARIEEGRT